MKRIFFLLILLLIVSLLSCSNNDSVLGPGQTDDIQSGSSPDAAQKITDHAIFEGTSDDDGDPWEDNGNDGDGDHGPGSVEPGQNDTSGGDDPKDPPVEPHDPTPGD
jgi:hypothetical protein